MVFGPGNDDRGRGADGGGPFDGAVLPVAVGAFSGELVDYLLEGNRLDLARELAVSMTPGESRDAALSEVALHLARKGLLQDAMDCCFKMQLESMGAAMLEAVKAYGGPDAASAKEQICRSVLGISRDLSDPEPRAFLQSALASELVGMGQKAVPVFQEAFASAEESIAKAASAEPDFSILLDVCLSVIKSGMPESRARRLLAPVVEKWSGKIPAELSMKMVIIHGYLGNEADAGRLLDSCRSDPLSYAYSCADLACVQAYLGKDMADRFETAIRAAHAIPGHSDRVHAQIHIAERMEDAGLDSKALLLETLRLVAFVRDQEARKEMMAAIASVGTAPQARYHWLAPF